MNDKVVPLFPKPDKFDFDPDNITGKYILVDRVPVPCPDLFKWGRFMEEAERHVAETMVEGVRVSTVFLGLDHEFGEGPPILFETMIFGGEHNQDYQTRCCTWDEAEKMHLVGIKAAKKGRKAPTSEWANRMLKKSLQILRKKR